MKPDKPRFLARNPAHAYTTDERMAMRGEPVEPDGLPDPTARGAEQAGLAASLVEEAVDPDEITELESTQAARERFDLEHRMEFARRDARTRSARLRDVQNEAMRVDADIGRVLAAIDAKLDEGRRILNRLRNAA